LYNFLASKNNKTALDLALYAGGIYAYNAALTGF
jgi:hypothetical protein